MVSLVLKSGDFIGASVNTSGGVLIQITDKDGQARAVLTIQESLEIITDLIQSVSKINEMQRHDRKTDPEGYAKPSQT